MDNRFIHIDVELDENQYPDIYWDASDNAAGRQKAKAMMLAFWNGEEKTVLQFDLWRDMFVDEMGDFVGQCLMQMANMYNRATGNKELSDEMKKFAAEFYNKAREYQKQP